MFPLSPNNTTVRFGGTTYRSVIGTLVVSDVSADVDEVWVECTFVHPTDDPGEHDRLVVSTSAAELSEALRVFGLDGLAVGDAIEGVALVVSGDVCVGWFIYQPSGVPMHHHFTHHSAATVVDYKQEVPASLAGITQLRRPIAVAA